MLERTSVIIVAFLVAAVSGYDDECERDNTCDCSYYGTCGLATGIVIVIIVVPLIYQAIWIVVAVLGYIKGDWQILASLLVFFFHCYGLSCALSMEKRSQIQARQTGVPATHVVYTPQQYQHPGPGVQVAYGQPAYGQGGVIHMQPPPQQANYGAQPYGMGVQPAPPQPPKYD